MSWLNNMSEPISMSSKIFQSAQATYLAPSLQENSLALQAIWRAAWKALCCSVTVATQLIRPKLESKVHLKENVFHGFSPLKWRISFFREAPGSPEHIRTAKITLNLRLKFKLMSSMCQACCMTRLTSHKEY